MDNPDGSYVDDSELTVFYQLLGVAPQVAALLYEPNMDEGVRAWLNDLYDAAPDPKTRRWLRALFVYYGLTGEPLRYQTIGDDLGVTVWVVRRLVARALRHLWFEACVYEYDRKTLKPLMDLALIANEWVTCDPTDTISFAVWVEDLTPEGIPTSELTARTPTSAAPHPGHEVRGPIDLWNPVYAGPDETRVIMKDGKPVV